MRSHRSRYRGVPSPWSVRLWLPWCCSRRCSPRSRPRSLRTPTSSALVEAGEVEQVTIDEDGRVRSERVDEELFTTVDDVAGYEEVRELVDFVLRP